jgi:acyl-CoA reductase-like NAD-dependent aldehyde dehydrogenase
MSAKIDQFTESLRLKLTKWESQINGLKADIETVERDGEATIESMLKAARLSVESQGEAVKAAGAKAKNWLKAKEEASVAVVQGWKDKHEQHKLEHRAERAEDSAGAAIYLAEAAITEAIVAIYEAMEARLATAAVGA